MLRYGVEKLLVLSSHFLTFVRDQSVVLAQNLQEINVLVHYSPFYELVKYIPKTRTTTKIYKKTLNKILHLSDLPNNLHVYPTPVYYILPVSKNPKVGEKIFKKFSKFVKTQNFQPDIIHAHFTWPSGYVAVKLGKEIGTPVIVTAHGYDVYDLPFRKQFWFDKVKWTLENANHIITVSKRNLEIITEEMGIPREKVSIIPNGFVGSLFKPMPKETARKKLKLPLDKKIILTVGNLKPIKGQKYLVDAMEKVVEKEKNALLIIVGGGELKSYLERQIENLKLENAVKLVGGKSHSEIPLWMNAADLFVLPSLSEGNPTVMFEALGVGLPFVGTAVGGVPEIITSEDYGFLCPPKDPECLAEKILVALEMDWDGEKIREYAEQFTWDNISNKVLEIYSNLGSDTLEKE